MKAFPLALAATVFLAMPAVAQNTDAPPPAASGGSGSGVGGGMGGGGKGGGGMSGGSDENKKIISACRDQAKGQGLKGPDMKKAVVDCVGKQKPKLAERLQCRQQGKGKGLDGDQLKSFIKDCMKGKG